MTAHARGSRRGVPDASAREGLLGLLAETLSNTPKLDGALCRGHHQLFDAFTSEDRAIAVTLCGRCSSLSACRDWADAEDRPLVGVIAGEYRGSSKDHQWCRRRRDVGEDAKHEGKNND